MTHLVIWPPRCSRDYFNFCLSIIRDKHRRTALMALVNVMAKILFCKLQLRVYRAIEAVCAQVIQWIVDFCSWLDHVHERSIVQSRKRIAISLAVKIFKFHKPFFCIEKFLINGERFIFDREEFLLERQKALLEICNNGGRVATGLGDLKTSLDEAERRFDVLSNIHERPSPRSGVCENQQNSRECASRPLREGRE